MTDAKLKRWGCFRTGCLTVTVLFVLLVGGIWLASSWSDKLPERFVLKIPVTGQIEERSPDSGLFSLGQKAEPLSLDALMTILDRARSDKRVQSVLLDINGLSTSAAKIQELSSSIDALRKSGKTVTALLRTPADKDYLLAVACDSIIVQKNSWLRLDGFKAELFFFAEPLKKLGIGFQAAQWKKYKSAIEPYTRRSPSPESLEELNSLLDDSWANYLDEVARRRNIGREAFREVVDSLAVLTPKQAQERKLIDRVLSIRQFQKEYRKRFGKPFDELVVNAGSYLSSTGDLKPHGTGNRIAVITINGLIVGDSIAGMGDGEETDVASVRRAVDAALDDSKVKAIVLRIDSPGGEALAASSMLELLEEAAQKKPLVASMSGSAASGGYMVALAANKIYAQPLTVTGSIGVFALKPDFSGLLEKTGIHREVLTRGRFADAYTPFKPFDDAAFRKFVETTGHIYEDFTGKVAKSRHLTAEQVEAVAGGRVWSGKRAVEVGLVDKIGGLSEAVQEASRLAKLKEGVKPELLYLPVRKTWIKRFFDGDAVQAVTAMSDHLFSRSLVQLLPVSQPSGTETVRFLLRTEEPQVLAIQPFGVEMN